jgi:CelD/BcsL family acetyltransferase involved in cellulose biosynthesis
VTAARRGSRPRKEQSRTATHDHRAKLPTREAEWLTFDEETAGNPSQKPDIVARLKAMS